MIYKYNFGSERKWKCQELELELESLDDDWKITFDVDQEDRGETKRQPLDHFEGPLT